MAGRDAAKRSLDLAFVGLGEVHRWHADAIGTLPQISGTVAFDVDPARMPRLNGVRRVHSLGELIADDPDAVLVSVPTPDHEAVAVSILERGIDVIVEKPAALDRRGLDRLYAIAARHGARLLVLFHDAFGIELQYFRTHLRSRLSAEYGAIREILCHFTDPYLAPRTSGDRLRSLYGSWHDSGVNALSVVGRLELGFRLVSCAMHPLEGLGDRGTIATYEAKRVEGPLLVVETDWTRKEKRKTTQLGFDDVTVILDHLRRTITRQEPSVDGTKERLFSAESVLPRLTEQYDSAFRALHRPKDAAEENRHFSSHVHGMLFDALEAASASE